MTEELWNSNFVNSYHGAKAIKNFWASKNPPVEFEHPALNWIVEIDKIQRAAAPRTSSSESQSTEASSWNND